MDGIRMNSEKRIKAITTEVTELLLQKNILIGTHFRSYYLRVHIS